MKKVIKNLQNRVSRDIDKIIIHCTATKENQDIDINQVRNWHIKGNGWSDIGYHYLIKLDGTIQEGRALEKIGSHCKGYNKSSIGIAYVGGLDLEGNPKDTRTIKQKRALLNQIKYLKELFPKVSIHGHNEFANKCCPCFDVKKEFE